jgi:hypothetical protein
MILMNCMENILRLIFKPFKYAQTVGATIWMLRVHGRIALPKCVKPLSGHHGLSRHKLNQDYTEEDE